MIMKNIISIIFVFISVLVSAADRDSSRVQGTILEALQKRDSILIGDQFRYGVRLVDVRPGTGLALPDWSKEFPAGERLMILGGWKLDTVRIDGRRKAPKYYDIEATVIVTSFEEGFYELPPVAVAIETPEGDHDTLYFDTKHLDVRTMPVDTATFVPHDIKGQIRYPVTPDEIIPFIAGFQFLALAVAVVVCIIIIRKRRESGESKRKEPAHIVALRKLDRYRGDKMWEAEKQKSFYSGVTDALREYIVSRYGVGAMEMTTKEIFDGLSGSDMSPELYAELKNLFERADFVKFAKYVATKEENADAVPLAVRFVTQTYQSLLEEENEEKKEEK